MVGRLKTLGVWTGQVTHRRCGGVLAVRGGVCWSRASGRGADQKVALKRPGWWVQRMVGVEGR